MKLRTDLWSDEDKEEAFRLWKDGRSGSEIGVRFGKSRNAILGLIHRNGLSNDFRRPSSKYNSASSCRKSVKRPKVVAAKPKRERKMNVPIVRPIPVVIEHLPNPTRLSMAADNQCRHIDGEPVADALICGAVVVSGTSWCAYHKQRLFYPVNQPSKRREPVSVYRQYVRAA